MNVGARGVSAETTISCTVQELGENVMKLFLFGVSLYIVLRGICLLLLFSRKRVPDAPVMIARFFVGSILCAVILGLGVSAHWLFSPGRGSSSVLTAQKHRTACQVARRSLAAPDSKPGRPVWS